MRRKYPQHEKAQIVDAILRAHELGEDWRAVCRDFDVTVQTVRRWAHELGAKDIP